MIRLKVGMMFKGLTVGTRGGGRRDRMVKDLVGGGRREHVRGKGMWNKKTHKLCVA